MEAAKQPGATHGVGHNTSDINAMQGDAMQIANEKYTGWNTLAQNEHCEIDRLCGAAAPFVEPATAVWPSGVPVDLSDTFAFHLARHELYTSLSAGGANLERPALDAMLYAHQRIGEPCQPWRAKRTARRMTEWITDPANRPRIEGILAIRRWWPGMVTSRCWQALVRAVVPVYAREGSSYDEIGPRVCALAPVSVLHGRRLGCSRRTVATVLREAGCAQHRRLWTDTEKELLKSTLANDRLSRAEHYVELGKRLRRSPEAVRLQARRMRRRGSSATSDFKTTDRRTGGQA